MYIALDIYNVGELLNKLYIIIFYNSKYYLNFKHIYIKIIFSL